MNKSPKKTDLPEFDVSTSVRALRKISQIYPEFVKLKSRFVGKGDHTEDFYSLTEFRNINGDPMPIDYRFDASKIDVAILEKAIDSYCVENGIRYAYRFDPSTANFFAEFGRSKYSGSKSMIETKLVALFSELEMESRSKNESATDDAS